MMVQTPQERALYEARLDAKRERSTDLTLARREGVNEGLVAAIELGLELKFGSSGLNLLEKVKPISDPAKVRSMLQQLKAATSLDDLRKLWP